MKRHPIEGGTIRAALFLGFGLTLGLWVWAGYQFTQRIADVQRDAAQTNGQYTRAQDLLSTVRAQLLLGSVYVRDALLDPNPQASDEYRRQLQETYTEAVEALEQYVPVEDSAMIRERVSQLGGTLRVESASGKGTRLTVELPARSRTTGEDSAVLPLSQVVEPVA